MAMENAERAGETALHEPKTAEEAWRVKRSLGHAASYVSGGTLLRTQWENGLKSMPRHLISLEKIGELSGIRLAGAHVRIGAAARLNECRAHPLLLRHGGLLVRAIGEIAAPSVRHLATLGGNVSSLTGDAIPALMAMDASVIFFRERCWRTESVRDWIQGAGAVREPDDLIGAIAIPVRSGDGEGDEEAGGSFEFYEKVGRREAFTPSLVTVAGQGMVSDDGALRDIRLSAGGGSALPDRLPAAERALSGARLSEEMLAVIHQTIKDQYKAAEDLFAGSGYRKEASANLITSQLWKRLKS
ncbi:FAD binding domain-containing protein [Paenibacillus soyae]|uniref:FAD binding domain-containing protein n=1 Tax=Paenibacillus soyae TaxID=2969249 RepID=A0A9X2MP02_9BACL|nr:FAD binding domain-containing protein [Paenibacillus soyae]MCR2805513.1 FAD binding domain-containing protein [Paenibacillus soyae]